MATAVSTTTFLFPPPTRHAPPSILLQHHRPPTPGAGPRTPFAAARPTPCSRRIRFAPLPDPRRSVLITDDGNELPFPQPAFATQFPAPPTPSPTVDPRRDYFALFDSASVCSSSSDSKLNSDSLDPSSSSSASSTPGTATPISITTTTPSEYDNGSVPPSPISCPPSPLAAVSSKLSAVSASSKSRPFSFLRGFKRTSIPSSSSSSNTLTPVASIDRTQTPTATSFSRRNFSADTLGTINLFRASSSRDTSDNEGPSSSGWSLARWSSAGSQHREPNWGAPLTRVSSTQSTQSYQSKSKLKSNASKNVRPSGLRPNRKGTRMLNGRVYGVKRPQNANPFANARDDEPEFVEWGYGGMGSVKGATSAGAHGRWERLHGQPTAAAVNRPEDDDDDGSGLAWVKRRREQKERERKEREEQETKDNQSEDEAKEDTAEAEDTAVEAPLVLEKKKDIPTLSRPGTASSAKTAASATSLATITPGTSSVSTPLANLPPKTSPTPPPTPAPPAGTPSADEEHVTRAVKLPAPHHYIHRNHSRSSSKDVKDITVADNKLPVVEDKVESESESRSSTSESDSESDREHEDEEDEEDSEEEEEERKTALGAGVEKISRHH